MKKILILPSWYATKNKFVGGAFFYEQSQFLNQNRVADFKVIYGEVVSKPLIKFIKVFLSVFVFSKFSVDKNYICQPPSGFGFEIPNNRNIPDYLLLLLSRKMYFILIRNLVLNNWVPDLIHCQSGMDTGIYAFDAKKKYKIPFVITEQQVFVFYYYSKYRGKILLDSYKNADKIGAGSNGQRAVILMNQPFCNPIVIWNLVNENNFKIELNKRQNVFTVITVLNSLPIKGFMTFVDAMVILKKNIADLRFIMIGKGGDLCNKHGNDASFTNYCRKVGVFNIGTFFPFLPRDKMNDVMNEAHVFVSPTIFEPHGIAAREAMMCGIPIVTTKNGGVEDSITKDTGLVVPVKDPIAMADAVIRIKENYSKYSSVKIRELAVNQCGSLNFLRNMTSFYQIN